MFSHFANSRTCRGPGSIYLIMIVFLLAGCSDNAPVPRPGTAILMPPEFNGVYLGIAKEEVDQRFTVEGTQLTDKGLETITRFTRDSVEIGLAFAYRDGRLSVATVWYDYSAVPRRVDQECWSFLDYIIEHNGTDYDRCSFDIPGAEHIPDIGLRWRHPGYQVVVTLSKRSEYLPDTLKFMPYYQFCIFDSATTTFDLWPNMIIPADGRELPYFHEVDSLTEAVRTRKGLQP